VLGDEVLLESGLLGDAVLPELEVPMPGLLLGDALLPLVALPCGQFAPTQSDELVPADELPEAELEDGLVTLDDDGVLDVDGVLVVAPADVLPVAELEDGLVVLDDDGVLDVDGVPVVAPADVLPVAELLVPPDAEVLELGVPVVAPAEVLPGLLLPLCAHAAQRNAAATAALIAFRFMQASCWLMHFAEEANRVPGL